MSTMLIPSYVLEVLSSKGSFQTFLIFVTMYLTSTFWRRRTWRRTVALVNKFPGPKTYGVLGNPSDLFRITMNPGREMMAFLKDLRDKYGPIYRFWALGHPRIVVTDAEIASYLYSNDLVMGKAECVYRAARSLGGEGLMALPAEKHPRRRKQWNPSFSRKQIENSLPFFRQQAVRLCEDLTKHAEANSVFDMVPLSVECTFRTICYSAFGKEYMNVLPNSVGSQHVEDLHTVSLTESNRMFRPWVSNDFLYFNATREGRDTFFRRERARNLIKQALQDRRQVYQQQEAATTTPRLSDDYGCFLDHLWRLMDAGELTEAEAIHELNVFIVAGYDTSGLTICYILYLLSRYPEHQAKVVEELCEVIPPEHWDTVSSYNITSANTKEMKYLELCIKEALRLYPILPVSPRSTTHDVTLPDGRIIPANVDVGIALNLIQRDPKYFQEPDRFWPERHLQPNPAFMPFTHGSRNCIGQVYAMYEMKTILAYLLMSYQWETMQTEELRLIFQTVQVPEHGLDFKITKRSFQ